MTAEIRWTFEPGQHAFGRVRGQAYRSAETEAKLGLRGLRSWNGWLPPLDFLCALYRDPRQPMQRRMKAAIAAAPFVHPKLSVTAVTDDAEDFAARLERARARSAKVIEARAEPPASDRSSPSPTGAG
jgi:hypothetical protein